MKDWHIHIGQYFDEYYDFHDVFHILKSNGVMECVLSYLTPKFDNVHNATNFYNSVVQEIKEARNYANKIALKANILYWADPLILETNSLEKIFSELEYNGIALHPLLHNWTTYYPQLLTKMFKFAQERNLPIFIHTGISESDEPLQFESWFYNFPDAEVHLAHCKDSKAIIHLFKKFNNIYGDTAFCPFDSYAEICKAGFENRMLFGSDFPISHYYTTHYSNKNISLEKQYTMDLRGYKNAV